MTDRALVLAGGGVAGIAWLLGVATALRDDGVDLAAADLVVGTSAGSAVAAQLLTGALDDAASAQQRAETAERAVDFDMATFSRLVADAAADASSPTDAARRIAQLPLQQREIDGPGRRAIVAARLPVIDWPAGDLHICAVDRDTGERVLFDRASTVGLVDAVTASCAVPGIWPDVEIAGRRYVDGGVRSLANADVAAGAHRTLILVPTLPDENQQGRLRSERDALATSLVITADDAAMAAFGPNPLDPARRPQAFAAGRRQGAAAASTVRSFWTR